MIDLLDVAAVRRWLADVGVASAITGIAGYIDADFRRWPAFHKTPRVANHSPEGVIELMPVSDGEQYAFKYVNGHPGNPARGYQTVAALGLLADVSTGYPLLISEMTVITALRTAAASAVAARALARPDSTTLALIGSGAQAEFQATAFETLLGIERVKVWDIDPHAMRTFERNMAGRTLKVDIASSVADAVDGADIVTTCTADKALATVLDDGLVRAGVHLNAIGGDCPGKTELDPRILHRSKVFVEYAPQTRVEGEIQHQSPDFPVTELWEVLVGERPGRTDPADITLFDSVGFAIEDFSALRYVHDSTRGANYLASVDLVVDPADPKNLWSLIADGESSRR